MGVLVSNCWSCRLIDEDKRVSITSFARDRGNIDFFFFNF